MNRVAQFSEDRKYRFTLWRDWSGELQSGFHFTECPHAGYYPGRADNFVQFIGLNPSTADEKNDDPTLRRCIDFAKRWGFGAMCMTNLFAFRSTEPEEMKRASDPVGEPGWPLRIARETDNGLVVACWGNHGLHMGQAHIVKAAFQKMGVPLHALRLTKAKQPEHPLYLKAETLPFAWT